jgi:hypothetical protein
VIRPGSGSPTFRGDQRLGFAPLAYRLAEGGCQRLRTARLNTVSYLGYTLRLDGEGPSGHPVAPPGASHSGRGRRFADS